MHLLHHIIAVEPLNGFQVASFLLNEAESFLTLLLFLIAKY